MKTFEENQKRSTCVYCGRKLFHRDLFQLKVPQYTHLNYKTVPMWVCKKPKERSPYALSCGEKLRNELIEVVQKFDERRLKLFLQ